MPYVAPGGNLRSIGKITDSSGSVVVSIQLYYILIFHHKPVIPKDWVGTHMRVAKEDAKPYALSLPRRVPLPLHDKVKVELQRMEKMGVIMPIEEATDWYTGMVVAPKPKGKVMLVT